MMKTAIQIKHLKYKYPGAKALAINNVNLSLFKGEWLSLVGLNGSGKSTLAKLIDGLLPKLSGQITVGHLLLNERNLLSIRSKIGIVFQNPKDQFVGVTVKDEVAFGLENQQLPPKRIKSRVIKSLSLVGMRRYYNSLIDNLSGGQQQRVAIADVIALKPSIMILDESTSMLNPQGSRMILHLINNLKRRFHLTVIDITHDVSETKYAQKIAIMSHGRIVASGRPNWIFKQSKLLRRLHLALPSTDVLRESLRDRGVQVPDAHFSETKMLIWLHRLFLNT